jgi:hypothetical protein
MRGPFSTMVTPASKKLLAMESENSPSLFTLKRKLKSGPKLLDYYIQRVLLWFAPPTYRASSLSQTLMGLCFLKTLLLPEAPGLEEALKSFRSFSGQIYQMPCEKSKHPYKVNLRSS